MSYDFVVTTDVDHLVVHLTRDDQLVIADYGVPILQGLLNRNDATRLRPRMEQRDPRFNQPGAGQERPNRDWPYVVAWVLMAMTLLPPRGRTPSLILIELFVLAVASCLILVLALVRAHEIEEAIEQAREGSQRINSILSGQILLGLAGLGTVVICTGLLALGWALGWLVEWLPPGFVGIALAVLAGATVALGKWIKQRVRGGG